MKNTNCERCGAELTAHQRRYCRECGEKARKEWRREKYRALPKEERKRLRAARGNRKKGDTVTGEHFEWEADICLNCNRGRCVNCLRDLTLEEKKEMLEKSGG